MLGRDALIHELCDHTTGFAITPIIDADTQIGDASIDLRLGPDIIVMRRETGVALFDAADVDRFRRRLDDYQTYVRRPFGSAFFLHPGQLALARTLEYVTLPDDLAAEAMGRSSWGRLGLIIATATMIQPGFSGTITLELVNLGNVPIVLYVGMRIAQLAVYRVERPLIRPKPWAGAPALDRGC
jgi:dCTP deaminase